MTTAVEEVNERDDVRLSELGYTAEFRREMSRWANLALGFTGPPMIWSFLLAGAAQFLVALVFGETVAQFPLAGGIYPCWVPCSWASGRGSSSSAGGACWSTSWRWPTGSARW
ncbi:hypothetical protein [Saccharopolyspora pogona]|uniref:hypothetical protein n=1 Tax=Saccharopolyspora pogona TaxID=333966 RepID=UPI001CC245EF|nr:hypothetical protein [Saccharopolyspora pogona]